jgi:hypothetical protein
MFKEILACRDHNTEIRAFDANGNPKKLWNENVFGKFLRLSGTEVRIPFLTGSYGTVMYNHNLITNVGHAAANGKLTNQGGYGNFLNIAVGSGSETAAATDMALSYEATTSGMARGAATASQVTTTITNDTAQLTKTFTLSSGTLGVTEAGIFDSSSGPTVTTLSAAISSTSATSASVTSGTGIANNDFLQIDNEIVQVTAGGGTTALTISRGQKGTTAATHSSGAGVVDFTAGGGNCLAKQTFAVVNLSANDSISLTWKVQS